jgi:nicotinic acid mononucleotide adenylyltransferase
MDKMRKMLTFMESLKGKKTKKYAVLLTTGAMNPVHKGHISLITQAKERIDADGYEVIGAWLSPSHDLYLQPKANKLNTIGLSAPFRVEATRLSVVNNQLIDVGLWESSLKLSGTDWSPSDYPQVCLALKEQIKKEFDSKYGKITVFYVCGSDHARNNQLYKTQSEWGGVVVVPRAGEKPEKENPAIKVYVAKPSYDTDDFSSTLIRKAIAENKQDIVKKMMPVHAARFLLDPTDEEYANFPDDFDKLKPVLLTKKEKLIDNNFKIPWIKTSGKFTLNSKKKLIDNNFKIPWIKTSGKFTLNSKKKPIKTRHGNYVFDQVTLKLITGIQGAYVQTSTVMYTKCMVSASEFREKSESESIKPKITPIIGKIQTEIQKPTRRHKIFVLPSQLNAAEYPNDITIITNVDYYKYDPTGGPLGQLSADPGVAQFIIDNACNENIPDKGINNVRLMGEIKGIRLQNGYLKVKDNVDVDAFKKAIPNMTIFGIKDIPVRGLDSAMKKFVNMEHKVDLIYASAVPYGKYGNSNHKNVRTIAKLTLFAQYVGSMRLAISRGDCELILMPLGGRFFKNALKDIKSAIISAYDYMEEELKKSKVTVYLLLYEEEEPEIDFFTK